MRRRDFIKMGLATWTWARLSTAGRAVPPVRAASAALAPLVHRFPGGPRMPRHVERLDFDWRFQPAPPASALHDRTLVDDWLWKIAAADQAAAVANPDTPVSPGDGWRTTHPSRLGVNHAQLSEPGYAWFRTVLPPLNHLGRRVEFTHVDDNAVVYLNGILLRRHHGWNSPFGADLDAAWASRGPNVLLVRVHNTGGPGGIYGPVAFGWTPELPWREKAAVELDDRSWRQVQLPHDYIVEGRYSPAADGGHGFLPVYPAWYRRRFTLPAWARDKSVWLYFEGVFRDARIYLNGQPLGRHPGGYTSFHVDITAHANYGGSNVLAVYVNPCDFEGWWYEGGGIYRPVWLTIAEKLHVAPWGVYVQSAVRNELDHPIAELTIETTVANGAAELQTCQVLSHVLDPDEREIATVQTALRVPPSAAAVPAEARAALLHPRDVDQSSYLHRGTRLVQRVSLPSVQLWSLEHPRRYRLVTEIIWQGAVVDRHEQKFGVRTIRFDPQRGFFLNEQPVKLQGTCNHQDFVGVGIGLPDSLWYYRMKRLKEFGCNAIRCSHNPMAPAMYDACDELGLLVMDENRHPGSSVAVKSWVGQPYANTWHVESMVLRDRNHPSVIMWSMWNEEFAIQGTGYDRKMMEALRQAVHRHDRTRPITCAFNAGVGQAWRVGAPSVEDLLGVNYNYQDYDWLHHEIPGKPIFGSEIGSNTECRGIYQTNQTAAHLSSYMAPDGSWQPLASRRFVAGGFYWTGFDYRGEPTPFGWPEINSNFGFLDMCGFPKDAAFYWKSWWQRKRPLVHIFPHWNWPGREGRPVPVWCFSNCDVVELFLNGRSLGKKALVEFGHLQWDQVPYQPGRLEARGYLDDKLVIVTAVETTGAPAAIRLTPDRVTMRADGQDTAPVAVAIVDAQGRVVPTAGNMVRFTVHGMGRNAGVGNGDPSCHEPSQAEYRSAFNGWCMVLVQAGRKPGRILLQASADGLRSARIAFRVTRP